MISVDGVEMVDVREAARLTHRTPETVRRWVWSGRIVAHKQGNRLFLPRSEVEQLVGTDTQPEAAPVSWREWAAWVSRERRGPPGTSAADLVLEDRAGR